MSKSINVVTMGCSKNWWIRSFLSQMAANGYKVVHDGGEADS